MNTAKILLPALMLMPLTAPAQGPQRLGEANPLIPPFVHVFDDYRQDLEREDFARHFQVIDANNDSRSWGYYNYSDGQGASKCAYLLPPLSGTVADDWLVTEAIRLEKDKFYRVSMDAGLWQDGAEARFEVRMGMYNDADGMDSVVIPMTPVSTKQWKLVQGWFKPKYSGLYYLGVHATQAAPFSYLFIDNIAVSEPSSGAAPGMVENFSIVNDPDGLNQTTLSWTAPTADFEGKPLDGNVDVVVIRDGTLLKRFNDIAPGTSQSLTDKTTEPAWHRYEIVATNQEGGNGKTLAVDEYVGIWATQNPEITLFKELDNGDIQLEWNAPKGDALGRHLNPESFTYDVFDASGEYGLDQIGWDQTERTFTYTPPTYGGRQTLLVMAIMAHINGKSSEYTPTEYMAIGPAYQLPYIHSFSSADEDHIVTVDTSDPEVTWRMLDDFSDPKAQDGDNGYASMVGNQPGQSCELASGKIDLTQTTSPALSFYTYVYEDDQNKLDIIVYDHLTGQKHIASTVELSQINGRGWQRVFIPLKEYAGKVIRFGLKGRIVTHGYIPVDNLRIDQMPDIDLTVHSFTTPSYAEVGTPYTVSATVTNSGAKASAPATAELLRDGVVVATAQIAPLESLESANVALMDNLASTASDFPVLKVRVNIEGDGNTADNVTDGKSLTCVGPNHPQPRNLTATEGEGRTVQLTWDAPALDNIAPEETTDDFESYAPYAENPGQWLTIDRDGGIIGGFVNLPMPIDNTVRSFWVMDISSPFDFMDAPSGHKILLQMYSREDNGYTSVQCDDWLISPPLYGGRQTVSFMASALSTEYGCETFEFYWSDGSTDPDDFHLVKGTTQVDESWTRYYMVIPDGAKRFALRCTSNDVYCLMLDDFTYVPQGIPSSLTHTGYNIYNGHELLATVHNDVTSFNTVRTAPRDEYRVTALYDKGESMAGKAAILDDNSSLPSPEPIYTDCVPEYYTLTGLKVNGDPAPGIYICKQGARTYKVVIK